MTCTYSYSTTRVILFTIDGLHWKAPGKVHMPTFNSLIVNGTHVKKSYMIIPHHPTVGDYSNYNSCSFPNPMLHEGTIFISNHNKMIQEMISPRHQTAFVVNTSAYRSVARGFTTTIMDSSLSDSDVVDQAIHVLENQDIRFMRVHLQIPGTMGESVALHSQGKPYSNDIWGEGSPYVAAIENADKQLDRFITYLKNSGLWDDTILIVTSDHGQSEVGWHPMLDDDSWITPLVIVGKGIAKERVLPYFEHIDIAPTIAWLLEVDSPNKNNTGSGSPVKEIHEDYNFSRDEFPRYIKTINEQVKEYNLLLAKMTLAAETDHSIANIIASLDNQNLTPEPFYHQDRILDWYEAGSIPHLIDANEIILAKIRKVVEDH